MSQNDSLNSLNNSFEETSFSFDKNIPKEYNKADSEDELNLNSKKYSKIGFLKDLNTIIISDAKIKYINKVKYYNDYKLIKKLGAGSLCKVKLVEKNNIKYALKIIDKKKLNNNNKRMFKDDSGNSSHLDGVLKEIEILKKVNHRNLVKLYEIIVNKPKGKIYLVLEYCEHGELMSYDEDKNKFYVNKHIFKKYLNNKSDSINIEELYYSETQIKKFVRQIIKGINYLHRIGIIHKDIKINNILLDKNNECKIIDFNLSAILNKQWIDNIGQNVNANDFFRAPELSDLTSSKVKFNGYMGMPLDIWAIGVTAYILSYKKFPFFADNIFDLYDKIVKDNLEIPDIPKRTDDFKHFLRKCLEKDPKKRITSEKILDLKWINFGQKEKLKNQCKKIVKFVPTKEEINKNKVFFSIDYENISKLEGNKRPVIKKISDKIMEKVQTTKDGKKVKIKVKLKNSKKYNEEDKK